MVTTKRNNIYNERGSSTITLIKERNVSSFEEFMGSTNVRGETDNEARVRMQKNLDRLLNYDRYNGENMSAVIDDARVDTTTETPVAVETSAPVKEFLDEDIKPTSTTLQFGDISSDGIVKDLSRQKNQEKGSYKLSSKGKLLVVLYSLAVTVILALIVLNTGIIARLSANKETTMKSLSNAITEYNVAVDERVAFSADENVIDIAVNEYGFVK